MLSIHCWPRNVDVRDPEAEQYAGWPLTIDQQDNFGKKPTAFLPEIIVKGAIDPVVQVVEEKSGEILYTLRIQGSRFQPWAFAPGRYTVFVGDDHLGPESRRKALRGLVASPERNRVPVRIGF